MKNNIKNIDILCVGEALIDFIGHQTNTLLNNTRDYHRYLGGSPTNVAMNSARLGLNSLIVATVGNDAFSEYIFKKLADAGVNTSTIRKIDYKPTSVIFVSKSEGTPDFIPFRAADCEITENQISTFAQSTDAKGNLKYPHFEQLRVKMGNLIDAGEAKGLEDAYAKYESYFPGHPPIAMDKMMMGYVRSVQGRGTGQVIRIYS